MALLDILGKAVAAIASSSAPAAEPIATVAGRTITMGEARAVAKAFGGSDVGGAMHDILSGQYQGWADAEPIGEAVLTALAAVLPEYAVGFVIAGLAWKEAPIIAQVFPQLLHPMNADDYPNRDPLGRGGRRD
jgi:hypothetical protein